MKFTEHEIELAVGKAALHRGIDYFKQGRVLTIANDPINPHQGGDQSVMVRSAVKGSGTQAYNQQVTIELDPSGEVNIYGDCSCPVGGQCKHVAAACMEYLSSLAENTAITPTAWLNAFNQASQAIVQPAINDRFVAYVLSEGPSPHLPTLMLGTASPLKKGGYGKFKPLKLQSLVDVYHFPPKYVTDVDQQIGTLLASGLASVWQNPDLSGEAAGLALAQMLQTGRCFWESIDHQVLVKGAARALETAWIKGEDVTELHVSVKSGGIVLLTSPPMYLDTEGFEIGLLETQFNVSQIKMLLAAPPVPNQQLDTFSFDMALDTKATALQPPKTVKIRDIQGVEPQPHLHLYAIEPDSAEGVHVMRLRFSYDGVEVKSLLMDEEVKSRNGDEITRVTRCLESEEPHIRRLLGLGFRAVEVYGDDFELNFISHEPVLMISMARWRKFLSDDIPLLEQDSWQVTIDDNFSLQFVEPPSSWDIEIEEGEDWFDLGFDLQINDSAGKPIPLLPLISEALNLFGDEPLPDQLCFPVGDQQFVTIQKTQIEPIIQILYELYDTAPSSDGKLRLSRYDLGRLDALDKASVQKIKWFGGDKLRELSKQLNQFDGIKTVNPPVGLNATLRDYQQQGLNWLQFMRQYGFNGILADDMGLGKTIQTLTLLLLEKKNQRLDRPCLIVAPTSLMSNWRRESEQFTPNLKVLVLQGADRHQHFGSIDQYDIVLTTYPLIVRDQEVLMSHEYHYLILDEAQIIKNPKAKASQAVRLIKTRHRLCLTGTPMENHLGELWALFDFAMPGFLGPKEYFNKSFRQPIEKHGDQTVAQRLSQRIAPFMLRRTKQGVAQELPEKTEIIRAVALEPKQAALYESIRLSMEKKIRDAIAEKGLARSHITILDALLKLRQTCCDPRLLPISHAKKITQSAKLSLLMTLVPEMIEEGRKILIFSQFTKMLELIEDELNAKGITYSKLTGQTRKREEVIDSFQSGEVDLFLISLKAGGVGLNLTEADTVIHYDPWWNPAVENQATDRAHRIGQHKPVFVYKLITENTLEEKIIEMQAKKQQLADNIYKGSKKTDDGGDVKITADLLKTLLAPI